MTTETILTSAQIDSLLEGVLRASGSRLGNYTYQKTLDDLHSSIRAIEQAVLQSPEVQALRRDAERIRALAREFDRARRGSGDTYMPIWNALCESIGSDDDGDEMLAAITATKEQQK